MQKRIWGWGLQAIQRVLHWRGAVAVRATGTATLEQWMQALRPMDAGIPLIRLGGEGDGGYLVPDDLQGVTACFSPGVSGTSSFERACYDRGMRLYLADHSVDQVGPELEGADFDFRKKFIGSQPLPHYMTLGSWAAAAGAPAGDWLLQMDIEGGEYEVLLEASPDLLNRFRVICVEFHFLTGVWNEAFFRFVELAFSKLLQDHVCVHIHPNNVCGTKSQGGLEVPDVMEFTFLRRDRVTAGLEPCARFPHPLDARNVLNQPDMRLPDCWWKA